MAPCPSISFLLPGSQDPTVNHILQPGFIPRALTLHDRMARGSTFCPVWLAYLLGSLWGCILTYPTTGYLSGSHHKQITVLWKADVECRRHLEEHLLGTLLFQAYTCVQAYMHLHVLSRGLTPKIALNTHCPLWPQFIHLPSLAMDQSDTQAQF